MKTLVILSSLLSIIVAQQSSLSCSYFLYGATYGCDLSINNSNGLNNFTEIAGIHLEGFSNADVSIVDRVNGVTTNIPSIICELFSNVVRIELFNGGITEIGDSAFGGCSQLTDIFLFMNSISSISQNAFTNLPGLRYINLERNDLATLPENVFANQVNLEHLVLSYNSFEGIPVGLFQPLQNLQFLELGYTNINAINNQWFVKNGRLIDLYLAGNRIVELADSFVGLDSLLWLNLANNLINEIPAGTFVQLPNLDSLYLFNNNITELQADSFPDLGHLVTLNLDQNQIGIIHEGAFRGLRNLTSLSLSSCRVRQLHSNSFEDLENLNYIDLNFNEIEELPHGVFEPTPNLLYIELWMNRLKTVRRSSFGQLTSLQALDLDQNIVNALDRTIVDDAVNLNTLFFFSNLCASEYFGNFLISRPQYLPMLERCFSNMRYIIETTTEGNAEFSFFAGPNPGIALRVNTENEVQIALTSFSVIWNPVIEIFIGTSNNTRSVIRINQERDVVTVPTPNIITRDQWNDFRVVWANQVVMVYRGNDSYPFMAFTMMDLFPVNFYGLRAVETSASWSVQPYDF